jgi:gliding motility-associated protein GldE
LEYGFLKITDALSGFSADSNGLQIIIELVIILILLYFSALMSAAEVAYFSFRSEDIRNLKAGKSKKSASALRLYEHPERLLNTILLTKNILIIAIVFISASLVFSIFDLTAGNLVWIIILFAVFTLLMILLSEVLPKVYATKNHTEVALFMAAPLSALQKFFNPLITLLIYSSSFVKKRQGMSRSGRIEDISAGLDSVRLNEDEKILKGIANFGNTSVSAIMCPRIDVTSIDIKWGFDRIIPVIISSGFSRIPVYSGSFDTVKGILYAKDVLPYVNNPPGFKWQSLLRPSYFVPETKKINELLKEFQLRKIHMAIVIDEYGGTSGIVTLEDILEEIVGEITDENDEDQTLFRKINDTTWIFEGKILLHDFCRIFGIDEDVFEEVRGESETLAGLILELTGEIPQKDQVIKYGDFIFRIESVDRRRIREIQVELISKHEDSE